MRTLVHVVIVAALLPLSPAKAAGTRAILIEARDLAYDANYRNDAAGLRSAIATLESLAGQPEEAAYANYYLSWTWWSLAGAEFQAKDLAGALASGTSAVKHARAALQGRGTDPEFHTALANALIVVAVLDRSQFDTISLELRDVRRRALELGPTSPRAVLMDAGMLFNNPPERGGGRDKGLARCEEALRLFDAEAAATSADPIAPRWGHALTYGWIANMYLLTSPPRVESARRAADTALRMRPDFWYVRDQVLPKLRE